MPGIRRISFVNGEMIPSLAAIALTGALTIAIIGLALLVVVSPIGATALSITIFAGIVCLLVPAGYVSAGLLIVVTACAVLVPVSAVGESLRLGPVSGFALLAAISVTSAMLAVARCGPSAILRGGKTTVLAAALILTLGTVSLVHGSPELLRGVLNWSIWASVFVLALCTPPRYVRIVLISWVVMALLSAAYAVYEYLAKLEPLYNSYLTEVGFSRSIGLTMSGEALFRAQSTFGHPIPLATFLVVSFALVLWAVQFSLGKLQGILQLIPLTLLGAGIVLTFSRSSWIALSVAVIVGLVYRRTKNTDRMRVIALCGVPMVILLLTSLGGSAFEYTQNLQSTLSFEQRAASLQSLPQLFGTGLGAVLVGAGIGAKQELYGGGVLQSVGGLQVVDNQYITLLIQVGLLGIALFVAMVWSALKTAHEKVLIVSRIADGATGRKTFIGVGLAFLSVLCAMFFYEGLYWPTTAVLFWSMLGFLARNDGRSAFVHPLTHHDRKTQRHVLVAITGESQNVPRT